jgi:putative ABC transport system permease protein
VTAIGSTLRVAGFLGRRSMTRGNHGITVLTVVMMSVIFAELLFVPSLIQGATTRIQNELQQYITSSITISPAGTDQLIPDAAGVVASARRDPDVTGATATVLAGNQVGFRSRTNSWPVIAVDPASYATTFATPRTMVAGSFLTGAASDDIVLGLGIAGNGDPTSSTYLASLQTVHVGDTVHATLLGGRTHDFTVRGIYATDLSQANNRAFISRATADALLPPLTGKYSTVYVKTRRVGQEQAVVDRLRRTYPDLDYQTWQSLAAIVKDVTGSFNTIKTILDAVSLVVAAIAVFIVTYVDLMNKRRTIGIERAIGISGAAITMSYLVKAVVFAVVGVALGLGIFYGLAVPAVRHHPFNFPIGPVTLSPTGSEIRRDALILVVVAVIGALLPAWRTVRTRLLDVIWG